MKKDISPPTLTPIQSPRGVNKNQTYLNMLKNLGEFSRIKNTIVITFEQLSAIFKVKFSQDNVEDSLIVEQFRDDKFIDIIKSMMIYVIFYDEVDGCLNSENLYRNIRENVNQLYRELLNNLVGKIRDYFKILIVIAYFMFYFLIDLEYYDETANHVSFLTFCLEIVHYEINGLNIHPNALKKTLLSKFQNNYKVPKVRHSNIDSKINSSPFDTVVRAKISEYLNSEKRKNAKVSTFTSAIENRIDNLKEVYKNTVSEFREDFERYKKTKNKSFELQHVKFRRMKGNRYLSQDFRTVVKPSKEKLDINTISQSLAANTYNPKRKHFISRLIRDFERSD